MSGKAAGKISKRPAVPGDGNVRLFTLNVAIMSGPLTKKFLSKNKTVERTIQIRGDQTLETLHRAIFAAFDREEEHMYEFQIGGEEPYDPRARRYVLPMAMDADFDESKPAGDVKRTTVESAGLKVDDRFGYWFDFGDDWWHEIEVVAIEESAPSGKFPRVTKRVGESPPQYANREEE